MSIILDALKKVQVKDTGDLLERLGHKRKVPPQKIPPRASVKVVAPEGHFPPNDFLDKAVEQVKKAPTWVLGAGLGAAIILAVMMILGLVMKLGNLARESDEASVVDVAETRIIHSTSAPVLSTHESNRAGFLMHPLVWSTAHPPETAASIKRQIGKLLSFTMPQDDWMSSAFQVSGIAAEAGGDPYVIINNKLLRVGEKINGARVARIDQNSVQLEWLGEVVTLQIH